MGVFVNLIQLQERQYITKPSISHQSTCSFLCNVSTEIS